MLILVNNFHEKSNTQKVEIDKILTVHKPFVICTCVTTSHSYYMKNALVFSQSATCNFFHLYYYKLNIWLEQTVKCSCECSTFMPLRSWLEYVYKKRMPHSEISEKKCLIYKIV